MKNNRGAPEIMFDRLDQVLHAHNAVWLLHGIEWRPIAAKERTGHKDIAEHQIGEK